MTRAVLDACVLYSAFLRDLFMRLTVRLAFQPLWTADIHNEWMRNVLLNRPDLARQPLEKTRTLMDRYGRDCLVTDYDHLIHSLDLPNPNDRHVLAAAIAADAPVVVTYNLSDFPAYALTPHKVKAQHPDQFLGTLFDADPKTFILALQDLLAALQSPPVTIENRLELMRKLGLQETARRVAEAFQEA